MSDLVLTKINRACEFLAEAKTLQEVNRVIALADAARIFAKRIKASQETTNYAAEVRIRAERKLGEMLIVMPKNPGVRKFAGDTKNGGSKPEPPKIPTLADVGIDKKTSSRAQLMALAPDVIFEKKVSEGKNGELNPNKFVKDLREERQRLDREEKPAPPRCDFDDAMQELSTQATRICAMCPMEGRKALAKRFRSIADEIEQTGGFAT